MKIIKVPFSKKVFEGLNTILMVLLLISIGVAVVNFNKNWLLFDISGFFIVLLLIYFIGKWRFKWIFMTTNMKMQFVEEITEEDFKLSNYNWENYQSETLEWSKSSGFRLEGNNALRFLYDGVERNLENRTSNWYKLLQSIPREKYANSSIEEFLSSLNNDLTTCKCCGKIAFRKEKCLSCGFEKYGSDEAEIFSSEEEYIREEQLELFSTMDDEEEIILKDDEDNGFDWDDNWQPSVTKEEVRAYSKKNYWD